MTYTNSALATIHIPSPNYSERTHPWGGNPEGIIDTVTIHHMACNGSLVILGEQFANPARQASSTYAIDTQGQIAQYVDECYRPWTSSSRYNDSRAVTIEVANDQGEPTWHVSDKAYEALILLVTDICRRNNIKKLNFTGDATGNLTMHCYFAATACPGPYLKSKFPDIAARVNKVLEGEQPMTDTEKAYVQGLEKRIKSLETEKAALIKEVKNLTSEDKILQKVDAAFDKRIGSVEDRTNIEYNKVSDLPKWAQPDIQYLVDKGILKGSDGKLALSYVELRMMCIMSRIAQGKA